MIDIVAPPGLTEITLTLTAEVDRHAAPPPTPAEAPDLAGLAAQIAAQTGLGPASPHHFLGPSPRITATPDIRRFAQTHARPGVSALHIFHDLGQALHDHMSFDAQATHVDTPPEAAFAQAKGVCQDFAQILIAALRSLGIPAAYVAGYLRTLPPEGKPRLIGADAMHAWVRAWMGTALGWVDYDPTNACFLGTDHLEVGFGRDYSDVAPVTGMLRLEGGQSGTHAVDIEEIGDPKDTPRIQDIPRIQDTPRAQNIEPTPPPLP